MKERPGASQTAPSGAFFSTGRGAAASPAPFRPPPSCLLGCKGAIAAPLSILLSALGKGRRRRLYCHPSLPAVPPVHRSAKYGCRPVARPFCRIAEKMGERPCHLPLFRRFLSIGVQERDCCPVALPFVCTAEGGRCVASSFLPAVHCLFGCKGAIAALCPFLCPHWWKGSGCVVCPFLRAAPLLIWGKGAIAALLPALLSARGKRERAHCFSLPACCSLSIGSRDAIAAPLPPLCPHRRRESSCAAVLSAYLSPCPLK